MADLNEYTAWMDEFVHEKGWYQPRTLRPQTPRNMAISLSIEAAEILEHFQWSDEPADKNALASELADVFLYLLQLARVSGIDLHQATIDKLERNRKRTWDENRRERR